MYDGKYLPVSFSRDTQEIPFVTAKIMMERFSKYENSNTIFEKFEFYDLRQEQYVKNKKKNDSNNINEKGNNSDSLS